MEACNLRPFASMVGLCKGVTRGNRESTSMDILPFLGTGFPRLTDTWDVLKKQLEEKGAVQRNMAGKGRGDGKWGGDGEGTVAKLT